MIDKSPWICIILFLALLTSCTRQDEQLRVAKEPTGRQISKKVNQVYSMQEIYASYTSSEQDWRDFLLCWNGQLIQVANKNKSTDVLSLLRQNRTRISTPASEEYRIRVVDLQQLSKTLGVPPFPPSFQHFMGISGGDWSASAHADMSLPGGNFNTINRIGLFKDVDKMNWSGWHNATRGASLELMDVPASEYYRYDESQDNFRWTYLDKLIKVGELEQGTVLLLNPLEITGDGEWEAWLLSTKVGAKRYRSFAELMQTIAYQEIRETGGYNVAREQLELACGGHLKTAATLQAVR